MSVQVTGYSGGRVQQGHRSVKGLRNGMNNSTAQYGFIPRSRRRLIAVMSMTHRIQRAERPQQASAGTLQYHPMMERQYHSAPAAKQGFIDWPTDASEMRRQLSPAADIASDRLWQLSAKSGPGQSQQGNPHSITSSAVASRPGGKLRPNASAVLRLITNSNLVDCMTGRSAGLSPLSIRPVYTPAWRYASIILVP
jgi:hypothetical protein